MSAATGEACDLCHNRCYGSCGQMPESQGPSFPLFRRFPTEIRLLIWQHAAEEREVQLIVSTIEREKKDPDSHPRLLTHLIFFVKSRPAFPPLVHSCREARNHGPYKRAFGGRGSVTHKKLGYRWENWFDREYNSDKHYTWVNFDKDTFRLHQDHVGCELLTEEGRNIRRLRIDMNNTARYLTRGQRYEELMDFQPLDSVHYTLLQDMGYLLGTDEELHVIAPEVKVSHKDGRVMENANDEGVTWEDVVEWAQIWEARPPRRRG